MTKLKPGRDTYVSVANALLDARNKAIAAGTMGAFDLKAVLGVLQGRGLEQDARRRVVIEVSGGVAECSFCPADVDVEIIDHDNREVEDGDCTCDERSWHGDQHDSACPLAGLDRTP